MQALKLSSSTCLLFLKAWAQSQELRNDTGLTSPALGIEVKSNNQVPPKLNPNALDKIQEASRTLRLWRLPENKLQNHEALTGLATCELQTHFFHHSYQTRVASATMRGERSHYITRHTDIEVTSSQAQTTPSLQAPLPLQKVA